jgi:hypothetical protein
MLVAKTMIRTFQRILHIAKDRVNPFEGRMVDGLLTATHCIRIMAASRIYNRFKTGVTIGDDHTTRAQMVHAPPLDFFVTEPFYFRQLNAKWLFIVSGLNGCNKGGFSSSTTASFSTHPFGTQVRVVNFDSTGDRFAAVALKHDLHDFMFNSPGGIIRNTHLAAQFQNGNSIFTLCNQKHSKKPFSQRQVRGVKNRAGRHRCLVVTSMTLKYFSIMNFTVGFIATKRAFESAGPAQVKQLITTFIFATILFHEIIKAHTFLKLYFILSHTKPPFLPVVIKYNYNISMAEKKW